MNSVTNGGRTSAELVLALGDSLTAGYRLRPEQSFASRLEVRLQERRPGSRVINAGVSGDTSAGGLARLPRLLDRQTRRPDLCLVELGANDAIRAIDPATTQANLEQILAELSRRGVPALLAGVVAPAFLGSYAIRFNAVFADVAARHGVPLYPSFLAGVAGRPGLVQADGLHPNAAAVDLVAASILPHVEAALPPLRDLAA
ncbi:arylesterase [Sphingomonas aerophila]|jgi:acyl-CoA thioesterase-1|uniref:arylesterase n=1 Tax=Sphingomonas aerophila TaxID=1344948 RepID=UPI001622A174|nr:arylesterase [Sphingomonas aerophila]